MFPDCDRPASWFEYHHILFWARDTGRTDLADLADAILLCRHHHLLLHTKGSEIRRDNTDYWLIHHPPSTTHAHHYACTHAAAHSPNSPTKEPDKGNARPEPGIRTSTGVQCRCRCRYSW